MKSLRVLAVLVFLAAGQCLMAQEKPSVVTMASRTFTTPAGFPSCITTAVQHGDPSKGPSVILTRIQSGCFTPWHWHHTNEGGVVVSGKIKL